MAYEPPSFAGVFVVFVFDRVQLLGGREIYRTRGNIFFGNACVLFVALAACLWSLVRRKRGQRRPPTVGRKGQNDSMNEQVAYALINLELKRLEKVSYADLAGLIRKVETKENCGEDGKKYQLEIQVFWDSKKGGDLRVIVAADDGGWRAFKPLSDSFIMRPDSSLV